MKRAGVKIFIFTLAVAVLCTTRVISHTAHAEPFVKPANLKFFSHLAVSRFDQDELLDRAALSGFGSIKSIRIYLSQSNKATVIVFKTESLEQGSIFALDIDNDGDVDLIWTDLRHSEDVKVWLGDGTGLFEPVQTNDYAQRFVINDSPALSIPDTQEAGCDVCVEDAPVQEAATDRQPFYLTLIKPDRNLGEQIHKDSCATETPSGRAPPSLLS